MRLMKAEQAPTFCLGATEHRGIRSLNNAAALGLAAAPL